MIYALETKAETSKTREMSETNEMEMASKIVAKAKVNTKPNQQISESSHIIIITQVLNVYTSSCV